MERERETERCEMDGERLANERRHEGPYFLIIENRTTNSKERRR
jgi:hypothetical protein